MINELSHIIDVNENTISSLVLHIPEYESVQKIHIRRVRRLGYSCDVIGLKDGFRRPSLVRASIVMHYRQILTMDSVQMFKELHVTTCIDAIASRQHFRVMFSSKIARDDNVELLI